jgi:HSP20 family protein
MAKSFNRHFSFLGSSKKVESGRLWYPAADVYQTSDGWIVKVELAGVSVEDVEIDIQGKVLSIIGARKDRSCAVGVSFHQMEITYSRFEKTLQFPSAIEGARIEHNFEDGILIIRLWKGD